MYIAPRGRVQNSSHVSTVPWSELKKDSDKDMIGVCAVLHCAVGPLGLP